MEFQRYLSPLILLFVLLTSCGPSLKSDKSLRISEDLSQTPPGSSQPEEGGPSQSPPPISNDPTSQICSRLDFKDVTWPTNLNFSEHTYYALALNITGSFEGRVGWKNIAGNFDGQGISLGLLQQNLGQGSLQPLLVNMFRLHFASLPNYFSSSQVASLKGMLEDWLNSEIQVNSRTLSLPQGEQLFPNDSAFNSLDMGYIEAQGGPGQSVSWARNNALDSSGQVLPIWKKSFQDMADSSFYRSQQLEASTKIFLKAKAYTEALNFKELRYLLLMFDFVVQNGSIGSQHLKIYENWLQNHPQATEEERALALLEARLTTVKPQYRADVRARKTTLIKMKGLVHGSQRDISQEYCFDPRVKVD